MRKLLLLGCVLFPMSCFAGDLTSRFELSLQRVLTGGPPYYTDEFVLADAVPRHERRFTEFSGDVSGRYLEALSAASEATGRSFSSLDRIVSGVLQLQKPDGHWGDPLSTATISNSDMALLWGNGRMLVGLTAYQRLRPRAEVLAAAERLGDLLVELSPRLSNDAVQKEFSDSRVAVGYICWTQILEGLTELARLTDDSGRKSRYLKLADQIAARTASYPAQHSHGFVCALRGLVDLSGLTGERRYLEQAEGEWKWMMESGNVLPQGALPEAFKPMISRDEGCSEADWLRFNLALWKATGHGRYLEQAEHCLFNEFYFNQFSSGDFGHHVVTENGMAPPAARAWWCCTFHGLRAFPEVMNSAFGLHRGDLSYDLPVDGRGKSPGGLHLSANSLLEREARVTLEVLEGGGSQQTLRVRIPGWAGAVRLQLGDSPLTAPVENGSLALTRVWTPGERLALEYELRTEMRRYPKNRIALFRGPWLLAVDSELAPRFFDEPSSRNRVRAPGTSATENLAQAPAPGETLNRFAVPVARTVVEYAPGGYPMQPQTALLRPIAEKTGSSDSTIWEFLLQPATGGERDL